MTKRPLLSRQLGATRNWLPSGIVSPFRVRPTIWKRARLHHHNEAAWRWCRMKDKTESEFFSSACGYPLQDLTRPLGLSYIWAFSARHFWLFFHLWSLVQTLSWVVSVEFLRSFIPRKGLTSITIHYLHHYYQSSCCCQSQIWTAVALPFLHNLKPETFKASFWGWWMMIAYSLCVESCFWVIVK